MIFSWSNIKVKRVLLYRKRKSVLKGIQFSQGVLGFKVCNSGIIRLKEIEAVLKLLKKEAKFAKRRFKIWITVYPNLQLTTKPLGSRMGRGKGKPGEKVVFVQKGRIILEWVGLSAEKAIKIMQQARLRFSLPVKIVKLVI